MMFATERVISNIYYNSKQGHVLLQKFSTTKTSFPILNNRKSSKPTHLYRNVLFLCFSWKPGEEYCKRSEVSFCCWLLLILNQEPHVFCFCCFFFPKALRRYNTMQHFFRFHVASTTAQELYGSNKFSSFTF